LDSFHANISYPENLKKSLQNSEATALVEHLSNYLRLANKSNLVQDHIDVIKHLPIFTEVDHTSPIPLLPLPENKNWYLLPREEEKSYGKIIYPNDKGGFINTISQNMCYILEDIIKIPRLAVSDYWKRYVIPFLESQTPRDMDIVVDKLFDRLPSLLNDINLKDDLGRRFFVPIGTFSMSQQQQTLNITNLAKPMELFDPGAKITTDLFFEDEQLFPAGKYGNSQKYLQNLRSLGIKSLLTPNDIISRIDVIIKRKETSNKELVRIKANRLLRYIDDKWDQITNNNDNASFEALLEKEWIPTVDESGKKFFSRPRDCYCKKYKNLVCLAAPVLEYNLRNDNLLKYLKWDTCPDVKVVLKQLEFCCSDVNHKRPPKELERICDEIYEYMNEAFQANDERSKGKFDFINESLKNVSWILCGNKDKFRSSDEVVIDLPNKFQNNDSLIVKLPIEYHRFKDMFKRMGVRDEIGVKDLVNYIKNIVKGDKNRVLDTREIDNVIMILEQIAKIRKDNRREGNENDTEELEGLLIPNNKNVLVDFREIHFDDMEGRLNGLNELNEYSIKHIAHDSITSDIATRLEIQTLIGEIYGNLNKYYILYFLIF
jgi:hypothetical protein